MSKFESIQLTKIDVAEAHIVTAVRNTFEYKHPASTYLLASSAREILTNLGHKMKVRTVLHGVAEETGKKLGRLAEVAHQHAGFMKHADRNPTEVLEFDPVSSDQVLFIACDDMARVSGGMPIEAQVFQAWFMATCFDRVSEAPLRQQKLVRAAIQYFSGIRSADRAGQCAIGLTALETAAKNPDFVMQINREVILPPDEGGS